MSAERTEHAGVDGDGDNQPAIAVYPRRYWILFLLSLASCQQSCTWLTFSPISTPVQNLYGWDSSTITLLAAWGPIIYVPLVLFTPAIVDKIGLRAAITLACGLTCVACVIRSLTTESPYAVVLAHAAQILNASAGPFVLATPSRLSATWFPAHHRNRSTSVAVMANYLGSGVGFLLALPVTTTHHVRVLLWGEAAFSVVVLLLCALDHAFFDPEPPLPPSLSAAVAATQTPGSHLQDVKTLLRNKDFLILILSSGLAGGTYSGWSGVLDPILSPLGYSQDTSSWLGFASTVGAIIGGLGFADLADRVPNFKYIIISLYIVATGFFCWFALLANDTIEHSLPALFVSCTLGTLFLNGTDGLFYEAVVETAYPVGEVATAGLLTIVFNIASGIYMVAAGHIAPTIMNWTLVGAIVAFTFLMLLFTERHNRKDIDEGLAEPAAAQAEGANEYAALLDPAQQGNMRYS